VHYSGRSEIVATPDRIFPFVVDLTRLGPCVPVPIKRVDDTHYRALAQVGSGMFGMTIGIDLSVEDVVANSSAKILASGGASGTKVASTIAVALSPGSIGGTTAVDWQVDIDVTGGFASAASRVIEEHAQDAIDQLIGCIQRQVEG
jgi:carbon monoxide dehydrogenase subunit G